VPHLSVGQCGFEAPSSHSQSVFETGPANVDPIHRWIDAFADCPTRQARWASGSPGWCGVDGALTESFSVKSVGLVGLVGLCVR
jgi:hypothetical protein